MGTGHAVEGQRHGVIPARPIVAQQRGVGTHQADQDAAAGVGTGHAAEGQRHGMIPARPIEAQQRGVGTRHAVEVQRHGLIPVRPIEVQQCGVGVGQVDQDAEARRGDRAR
jgi:hypothetical protein